MQWKQWDVLETIGLTGDTGSYYKNTGTYWREWDLLMKLEHSGTLVTLGCTENTRMNWRHWDMQETVGPTDETGTYWKQWEVLVTQAGVVTLPVSFVVKRKIFKIVWRDQTWRSGSLIWEKIKRLIHCEEDLVSAVATLFCFLANFSSLFTLKYFLKTSCLGGSQDSSSRLEIMTLDYFIYLLKGQNV